MSDMSDNKKYYEDILKTKMDIVNQAIEVCKNEMAYFSEKSKEGIGKGGMSSSTLGFFNQASDSFVKLSKEQRAIQKELDERLEVK